MLETCTAETFTKLRSSAFTLTVSEADEPGQNGSEEDAAGEERSNELDLELVEVVQAQPPQPGPGIGRAPFSVTFLNRTQRVLPQSTYRLLHDELGAFELFIVPIARDAEGVRYEAVFT
jgi:hypothetical protein